MQRVAFLMHLKPGAEAEYERRHAAVWPGLVALLRERGMRNYSIFRSGLDLFAYLEAEDPARLPGVVDELMLEWWTYMEPLMISHPDGSPVQEPLDEVFHLD